MGTAEERYDALLLACRPRPIHTEREWKKALRQIETLMSHPNVGKAESEMIEVLATLIEQYEETRFPTPTGDPVEMLEHLLDANDLTRAQLARETGIPRSVITNILSRRRGISVANAKKLSERFRVSLENLIAAR